MFFRTALTATAASLLLIAGTASAQNAADRVTDPIAEARSATGAVNTGAEVMTTDDEYLINGRSSATQDQDVLNITEFPADSEKKLSDRY
ncbi:MAG: hypothetical protein AAF891_01920 [Pseudomonadota bacterium]